MKEINGIPIFQTSEIIKPILDRYGRCANDIAIRDDIVADIRRAIDSSDVNAIRLFLSEEQTYWLGNLQSAYFQQFKGLAPLQGYEDWARIKCDLLLAVASQTREYDGIIQHLLNYEDFHVEVLPLPFGPSFIVRLYEIRGLDFFLFHYVGGETSAHEDTALFKHAESIIQSLRTCFKIANERKNRYGSVVKKHPTNGRSRSDDSDIQVFQRFEFEAMADYQSFAS